MSRIFSTLIIAAFISVIFAGQSQADFGTFGLDDDTFINRCTGGPGNCGDAAADPPHHLKNFGDTGVLKARYKFFPGCKNEPKYFHILTKFDSSRLDMASGDVTSATLRLYQKTGAAGNTLDLYRVKPSVFSPANSDWDESSVTWSYRDLTGNIKGPNEPTPCIYDGSDSDVAACICDLPGNKTSYRPAGTPWDSLEHNAGWAFVGDAGGPVIYGEDEGGHYMTSVNLSEIPRSNSLDPLVFVDGNPGCEAGCWAGDHDCLHHESPKLGGGDFGNWQGLTYNSADPLGYSGFSAPDASSVTLGFGNWMEWDITDLVKHWIDNDDNYGMLLKWHDEDWNACNPNPEWTAEFWSKEGGPLGVQPEIVLVPEPATITLLFGLGVLGLLRRKRGA